MAAVCRILGTNLLTLGPGLSARRRWTEYPPPLPPMGTMARRNTKIPMPPSQWVKERQNRSPLDMGSTAVKMDAPVVVKPEMTSKRAST